MDVVEKRRRRGRIKTRSLDGQEIELRISTLPTAFGEKLVMIFDPKCWCATSGARLLTTTASAEGHDRYHRHRAGDRQTGRARPPRCIRR
jgi:type II secretory ATPase GspE/PulE/Tfp pilus assembly ATPase PilB-like protein